MSSSNSCVDRSFGLLPKDMQLTNLKNNDIVATKKLSACEIVANDIKAGTIEAGIGTFDTLIINNLPPSSDLWRYAADSVSGAPTVQLNPAFLGAIIPSDLVFPFTTEEGAGTRLAFDYAKGAIRAGIVSAGQWDSANRGIGSVAFGIDTTASGTESVSSGGIGNTASGSQSTIGGGQTNTASNTFATVGGGAANTASGIQSTVGGGQNNTASGVSSTISGGIGNVASGLASVVCGGTGNTAGVLVQAAVVGGSGNVASGVQSFVGGGVNHNANASHATICGGSTNLISAGCTEGGIVSGIQNQIVDLSHPPIRSFIGGGETNIIQATGSVGTDNRGYNVIAGGLNNLIDQTGPNSNFPAGIAQERNFIGGGEANTIDGEYSVICGGFQNQTLPSPGQQNGNNVIAGGSLNKINGNSSVIGGGSGNTLNPVGGDCNLCVIAGGQLNSVISPGAALHFMGGGNLNVIDTDLAASIVGGTTNTITNAGGNPHGQLCFIGGGTNNSNSGVKSFIGAGEDNIITAFGGGVSGSQAIVAGSGNEVVAIAPNNSNIGGFIGGGTSNRVSGNNSSAAGNSAHAYNDNQDAFASGKSGLGVNRGDSQVSRYVAKTNVFVTVPTVLNRSGGLTTIELPRTGAYFIRVDAVGVNLAATNSFSISQVASAQTVGGVLTLVGGTPATITGPFNNGCIGASVTLSALAATARFQVTVTGTDAVAAGLRWTAYIEVVECTFA